jgi:hypothetical protein
VPPRLPDDKRAAILADIKARQKSRARIARDHGVSPQTVGNIALDAQVVEPFSRLQTKNATEAAMVDCRAVRAVTARRLLAKANDLLDQMDRPCIVFNIGGKDNVYTEHPMDRPPTADLRNLMVTAATALDKHMALDKHDATDPGGAASLLGALFEGLQQRHGAGDA